MDEQTQHVIGLLQTLRESLVEPELPRPVRIAADPASFDPVGCTCRLLENSLGRPHLIRGDCPVCRAMQERNVTLKLDAMHSRTGWEPEDDFLRDMQDLREAQAMQDMRKARDA